MKMQNRGGGIQALCPRWWQLLLAVLPIGGAVWFSVPFFTMGFLGVGMLFGWGVCLCVFLGVLLFPGMIRSGRGKKTAITLSVLEAVGLLWMGACTAMILTPAVSSPPEDAVVLVLGCKVNRDGSPSDSLTRRIDAAAGYLLQHPDALCVASGGQGENEPEAESDVIKRELIERGVEEDRIFTEPASTTTEENMAFSAALLQEKGLSNQIVMVTEDFHQYRAARLARSEGLDPYPIACPSRPAMFPANYGREVMALTLYWLSFGHFTG